MLESKTSVIMSGADEEVFNKNGLSKLNKEKIKFVTHHWSNHFNKGFLRCICKWNLIRLE